MVFTNTYLLKKILMIMLGTKTEKTKMISKIYNEDID